MEDEIPAVVMLGVVTERVREYVGLLIVVEIPAMVVSGVVTESIGEEF